MKLDNRILNAKKVEDGTDDIWPCIIAGILEQLKYSNKNIIDLPYQFFPRQVINGQSVIVSEIKYQAKLRRMATVRC